MTRNSVAEIEYTLQRVREQAAIRVLTAKLAEAFLNQLRQQGKVIQFPDRVWYEPKDAA